MSASKPGGGGGGGVAGCATQLDNLLLQTMLSTWKRTHQRWDTSILRALLCRA